MSNPAIPPQSLLTQAASILPACTVAASIRSNVGKLLDMSPVKSEPYL